MACACCAGIAGLQDEPALGQSRAGPGSFPVHETLAGNRFHGLEGVCEEEIGEAAEACESCQAQQADAIKTGAILLEGCNITSSSQECVNLQGHGSNHHGYWYQEISSCA